MATLTTAGTSPVKQGTTAAERVLLVEGDITLQNTIHEALISEGYEVEIVSSGPIRLALFRRESLSSPIINSQFPASQEPDLSREFMQAFPATAFVLLSATPCIRDNAFFSEMESDDPPSFVKELVARLGCLPRLGCQSLSESLYVFGDIIVDFVRMEVVRGRVQISLTMKEFRTLEFLIKNAGRAISRDELLNKVWGYNSYPCTRTVDNHILRLRQKLENDPSNPAHLVTMHGLGYKFVP
jgi:DNA-binding response OmpR family regulator